MQMFTHTILLTLSITLNLHVINSYLPVIFVDSPHVACMIATASQPHIDIITEVTGTWFQTAIYKLEFSFEAFAIRFVTAVSGVYLTKGATLSV